MVVYLGFVILTYILLTLVWFYSIYSFFRIPFIPQLAFYLNFYYSAIFLSLIAAFFDISTVLFSLDFQKQYQGIFSNIMTLFVIYGIIWVNIQILGLFSFLEDRITTARIRYILLLFVVIFMPNLITNLAYFFHTILKRGTEYWFSVLQNIGTIGGIVTIISGMLYDNLQLLLISYLCWQFNKKKNEIETKKLFKSATLLNAWVVILDWCGAALSLIPFNGEDKDARVFSTALASIKIAILCYHASTQTLLFKNYRIFAFAGDPRISTPTTTADDLSVNPDSKTFVNYGLISNSETMINPNLVLDMEIKSPSLKEIIEL